MMSKSLRDASRASSFLAAAGGMFAVAETLPGRSGWKMVVGYVAVKQGL